MLNKSSAFWCLIVEGYLKDNIYLYDLMDKSYFCRGSGCRKMWYFFETVKFRKKKFRYGRYYIRLARRNQLLFVPEISDFEEPYIVWYFFLVVVLFKAWF